MSEIRSLLDCYANYLCAPLRKVDYSQSLVEYKVDPDPAIVQLTGSQTVNRVWVQIENKVQENQKLKIEMIEGLLSVRKGGNVLIEVDKKWLNRIDKGLEELRKKSVEWTNFLALKQHVSGPFGISALLTFKKGSTTCYVKNHEQGIHISTLVEGTSGGLVAKLNQAGFVESFTLFGISQSYETLPDEWKSAFKIVQNAVQNAK